MTKHLLTISDLTKNEIDAIFEKTSFFKERQIRRIPHNPLIDKSIGLIFDKASTRTRVSFEVAMHQLGGHAIFISHRDSQIGRGESIKDSARALSSGHSAIKLLRSLQNILLFQL